MSKGTSWGWRFFQGGPAGRHPNDANATKSTLTNKSVRRIPPGERPRAGGMGQNKPPPSPLFWFTRKPK